MTSNTQIYSATYSNVPVFEFVTSEGPIMRRKLDSWINATHILKIAKFPKAKRTRILEKDVQTDTHEKVQGGYGKYQGTYVPLDLGAKIARNFNVYDILKPIFEFTYVEGKSETPPPAPKHNHASALNIAKRQNSDLKKQKALGPLPGEPPKKRGRPKRATLKRSPPAGLNRMDTTQIESGVLQSGPSIGNFEPATRQDTEQDPVLISTVNLKPEDLQLVESDDENLNGHLISHNDELFTSKELFGASRESFEKVVYNHSNNAHLNHTLDHNNDSASNNQNIRSTNGNMNYYQPSVTEQVYADYFQSLLTYFVEDTKVRTQDIPDKLLNPPQPLLKININQQIDNEGNTIFHWACSMAQVNMIEFLMNTFEITPSIQNNKGETPLMFLVNFSNAFQLKTFPSILELLHGLIFSVDNSNKTVLHHIAMIGNGATKNKERCARYYMEILFDKIIASDDNNKQVMRKFINHQDSDGNTAFHISASYLSKKCIKVFISYHRYLDLSLRNLASYTVEDYLASHNYVLRLDNSTINEDDENITDGNPMNALQSTQSFESQLYYSKMAVNLQNSTANLITEKLSELAYSIDKELSEKDEVILTFFKILQSRGQTKLQSQKAILSIFKLDHLVEDLEKTFQESNVNDLTIDFKRDQLIQEEIYRLVNDLYFQILQKQNELEKLQEKLKFITEKIVLKQLNESIEGAKKEDNEVSDTEENRLKLSIELTEEIIRRKKLISSMIQKQLEVPSLDEFKENQKLSSIVSTYSQDDKLSKYCKLISLCCGMSVNEVENSIDLIEQSLMKSNK